MSNLFRRAAAVALQLVLGLAPVGAMALSVDSVEDLKVKDTGRGKTLDVRINYPEGEGPFPVILFSHGAGSSKDDYQPLMREWASHGYVVLQVNHDDSGSHDRQSRVQAWSSRPQDLSALIDHLDDIEAQVPGLRGKIDSKHIGAAGHSFGGQTMQMIGGYKMAGVESHREDRVKAVVLLAPPGGGPGDSSRSWSEMRLPMLTIVGGADTGRTGEGPVWRMDAYKNAPAQDDFAIVVDKADHLLGGISETRAGKPVPKTEDQLQLVYAATTSFFDAYLKGDHSACNSFASGEVVAQTPASARFLSKSGVQLRSASAPDRVQFASASESLIQKYDMNRDGVMQRDEAPSRLPDRAFDSLDTNGDGVLDEDEAKALSDRLQSRAGGGGGGGGRYGRGRHGAASDSGGSSATESAPIEMEPITQTKSTDTAVCHVPR
jgi:predicted dienelactone hydrolase